jgi:hypothetical protein
MIALSMRYCVLLDAMPLWGFRFGKIMRTGALSQLGAADAEMAELTSFAHSAIAGSGSPLVAAHCTVTLRVPWMFHVV